MIPNSELEAYFDATKYVIRNGQFVCTCPQCKKPDHLYCSIHTGAFICFKCGYKGKIDTGNVTPAMEGFKDMVSGLELDGDVETSFKEQKNLSLRGSISVAYHPRARNYLIGRGISLEEMKERNIRYFKNRIYFPNKWDSQKFLTDLWVSRGYTQDKNAKRYLFPKNHPTKYFVYNLHNIEKDADYIIITEGVINSIIAGKKSVCIYSKFCSKSQLYQLIEKAPRSYYVALDFDAKKYAYRLAKNLHKETSSDVFLVNFRDDRDVADLGRDQFTEVLLQSIPFENRLRVNLEFF